MPNSSAIPLDLDWVNSSQVNLYSVKETCANIIRRRCVTEANAIAWHLRAITCIDLTTLSGDDTPSKIFRLCSKAVAPLCKEITDFIGLSVTTGAVCVYPARVADCVQSFKDLGAAVPVAAVATGFPTGQYSLSCRLEEIKYAVEEGASEIDIVINRAAALQHDWERVYEEIVDMKRACKRANLKAILATGELGSLQNVYKASLVAMMAGADFIKTSTGKENVNANLPVGLTMLRAIEEFYQETHRKVGFKPAGGIHTAKDALNWQLLTNAILGEKWLYNDLFRIGASDLLGDLEKQVFVYATRSVWKS
ncbi:deoxyribose-phosphate aldolase-like [Varroa jacobsoni]|uniref:deoxyribose-phosphate aldolase n=1 Tax=Varroa destructor TaxID=109461 RepID=A0A7M7KVL1_VARDE|nr:deoxyribose-phosphate aldolase-like [Varroa destructor]XP_022669583.1 deoxyribose-phosphate aldolase-like [Varroa destructor]XP_022669584.1 deoxyribose-phosphate aldolase-like [Varroa destructor]XP_022669585.1 deoxyribose-phosphate aldolase-like [Varroa destructor]XP_022669586.1 deoxyribose-phosphate aldolase-like [Varroa destructor]XP_022669587.1 deoxyribose-phosphate aldolase-like [Varroa destructor]XP_022703966.1 deoxyribose-phosphate aldolase-like [Varroa jacobsoni]XP_022703967.1 deox